MTDITFYRRSLWAPIVVPLVLAPLQWILPNGAVKEALFLLPLALVFGGIPYAIVATMLYFWLRDKSARTVRRIALVLPVGFAVLIFLIFTGLGLAAAAPGRLRDSGATTTGAAFGLIALLVGTFYAVLVEVARFFAVQLRLVDPVPSR
jgi:hypothetical protein